MNEVEEDLLAGGGYASGLFCAGERTATGENGDRLAGMAG